MPLSRLLALLALSTGTGAAASFPLSAPIATSLPLRAGSGQTVQLRLLRPQKALEVRVGGRVQTFELPTLDFAEISSGDLLVADFNFDGYLDLMIPQDTGYGGVNYFNALYVYDPRARSFAPLNKPLKDDPLWCNPVADAQTRTLQTECKSGPVYYGQDFRFVRGRPVLYSDATPAFLSGFGDRDEALLFLITVGKTTTLSEAMHSVKPVMRSLITDRADLYTAPRLSAKTGRFIVRGDRVQVLRVANDGWCQVVYQSRRAGRIVAWIQVPDAEVLSP
jgi:hypothetical protein